MPLDDKNDTLVGVDDSLLFPMQVATGGLPPSSLPLVVRAWLGVEEHFPDIRKGWEARIGHRQAEVREGARTDDRNPVVLCFGTAVCNVEAAVADAFWLRDAQGAVIEPHRSKDPSGPEREDDRGIIAGILHVRTSGRPVDRRQEIRADHARRPTPTHSGRQPLEEG